MKALAHTGLDVLGLVPGVGEIADGTNALLYASEGDYLNAGLSAAAMIPFGGLAATGGKWTNKSIKYLDRVEDATDLYHNYPRAFDNHIIENGAWSQRIKDGADWYEMPGSVMVIPGIMKLVLIARRSFSS